MEFHIELAGLRLDPGVVEQAIRVVDPSALADIDPAGHSLRVATSVDAIQLVSLLRQAGYHVAQDQLTQAPSICCGGCSG